MKELITNTLYRYIRPDGGVTISTVCPEVEYQTLYRIIADDGYLLNKEGYDAVPSTDVEDPSGWTEELATIVEEVEQTPDPSTSEQDELERFSILQSGNENPREIKLSPIEYLEWQDYKNRVSIMEYQISLLLNSKRSE